MKDVDDLRTAPVCASGSQILYAWAMDAPKLDLPAGRAAANVAIITMHCSNNIITK